uniref:Conserved secreted protein n=1 Tax=Parastrongyloides trichosuri TaxID=131310 RepID=A0A0N4YZZ1_PARTI
MKFCTTFWAFTCIIFGFISNCNGQENQELVDFAQKVFINVNNITSALQEGKQTDIRKSISSILGGGLLGQIAENPIRLADHFGIDLDNFGLNRTILEQTIGINTGNNNVKETAKGDQIFGLSKNNKKYVEETTTQAPTTTVATTTMKKELPQKAGSFDSVFLDDFGNVLPMTSFVQQDPIEISRSAVPSPIYSQHSAMPPSTSSEYFVSSTPAPIPQSSTLTAKIDEIQEIKEQLKKLEQLLILREFSQKYPDLASKIVSYNSPKAPQQEQYQSTPSPVQYIPQMQQQPIVQQSQPILQNAPLRSQQPTSSIEFSTAPQITRASYVPDNIQYSSKKHQIERNQGDTSKQQKQVGRSSRISFLQNQPRYAQQKDNSKMAIDFSTDNVVESINNPTTSDVKCECLEMDIDQLKGSWTKAMSSNLMITKFKKIVGKMFGMDGKMELTCSAFTIIPSDVDDLTGKVQWTFKTPNSKRSFKINGILKLINEKRTILITFTDFNGFVTEIPLCVLKSSDTSNRNKINEYIVFVENNVCTEPVLMISNPQNFFDQVNHELIGYLKHMIKSEQFSTMDIVSTGETCTNM